MKQTIIRLNPPELPDTGAIGYSQISGTWVSRWLLLARMLEPL